MQSNIEDYIKSPLQKDQFLYKQNISKTQPSLFNSISEVTAVKKRPEMLFSDSSSSVQYR